MKILIVHNAYQQRGGEDTCVQNEVDILQKAGLEVSVFRTQTTVGLGAIQNAILAPFGGGEEKRLEKVLFDSRPDVLHAHNLYPLLSAKIFATAKASGIRTIQTLHNFRPICLNGLFMTPKLEICERCTPGNHTPGVLRGCYRTSRIQSTGLALHLRKAQNEDWYQFVDTFIAPSQFLKEKYEKFKPFTGRIVVQSHGVPFKEFQTPVEAFPYILFLGRLSEEKGISWLVNQFKSAPHGGITLKVAGQGPLKNVVLAAGKTVDYAGYVEGKAKESLLRHATALVMPSECYENFPLAIVEANLRGIPALVADHGGLSERVIPGITGERYRPRDSSSFWQALGRLSSHAASLANRVACQNEALKDFAPEVFVKRRLEIYGFA